MERRSSLRETTLRVRHGEHGYVLLSLLLVVSLMVIAAAAALPLLSFEIKRDREAEMIHRGVQYSRAIRGYYKKFGRYPTRLEDLDNTNNLRYLRKHYKDPLNKDQDFRLLHFGDPDLKLTGTIGGGTIPGASAVGSPSAMNGSGPGGSAFGGSSFGGSAPGGSSFGSSSSGGSAFGNSGVNSSGVFAQSSAFGGNTNNRMGGSSNSQPNSDQSAPNSPSDPSQASSQTQVSPTSGSNKADTSSSSQQVISGGPIVGVASLSKKDTIREFNKKKKYNEWQFIYDPTADRGGLITTPYQPALQGLAGQPGQMGQPAQNVQPGANGGSPFGQSPSLFNNQNPGQNTTPTPPPSTSPQPQ
jgi:type II secretory pathway pseudopilin PulG